MIKKRYLTSLSSRFAVVMILALALATAFFFLITNIGNRLILENYMSADAKTARENAIFGEFSNYVHIFNITSHDSISIAKWSDEHKYAQIFIYTDKSLSMQIGNGVAEKGSLFLPESGYLGKLYTLRFADSVCRVAVTDSSETRLYGIVNVIGLAGSAMLLFIVLLSFFNVQTRRIIRLSREASRISAGDMDAELTKTGHDEISALAASMDRMRNSVAERTKSENQALKANYDLITAISHDIRTPMTSMLGYLEMLSDSDLEDKEQAHAFVSSAHSKALELRELTDSLFKYFLVFGKKELDMALEDFEADILIEQLAAEAEYELLDCGFSTKRIGEVPNVTVCVDPLYLKRVMDNIISNVRKYADAEHLVVFLIDCSADRISLCVSNNIKPRPEAESTKIGIRTCEKIMESLGGKFLSQRDEEHFMAEMILPIKQQ